MPIQASSHPSPRAAATGTTRSFRGAGPSSHDILTCSIKSPAFAYANLELDTESEPEPAALLDSLLVKSYCTAALRQFLGLTGAAIPLDILKVQGRECWVRVPRPDLGSFAAAITAWKGTNEGASHRLLRIKKCSDWLGMMVGVDGQNAVWGS